ncbi:MAG: dUTP pyrophosphatase [Miltoncostaeaceae bacterium]|nr:dUTP pyrophosphatase [Miltoncostaeaceae bacterium]
MNGADELPVRRLRADALLPRRAHPGDAGLDLFAAEPLELAPGERAAVPTGLAIAVPDGHAGLVLPRSGLAREHGITVANAPGLIDQGYRGELMVLLVNLGSRPHRIEAGDRVAQLVVAPVSAAVPVEVSELPASPAAAARGAGGFGSTGR